MTVAAACVRQVETLQQMVSTRSTSRYFMFATVDDVAEHFSRFCAQLTSPATPPPPAIAAPPPPAGVVCENTCQFADDGDCDDGGAGSIGFYCKLGTDCKVRAGPNPPPANYTR